MDARLARILLAALLVGTGIVVGFFLWGIGSQSAYAALIPLLAGLFLAVGPSSTGLRPQPGVARVFLGLGWLAAAGACWASLGGPRGDAYFAAVPAAVGFLLLAAFFDGRRLALPLAGILAVFVLVRWSSYNAFATFAGSDSFFHALVTQHVLATGHVAPASLADKYALTPGMHILVASTSLLTGLGVPDAMFWSITLSQLAVPLALVSLGHRSGQAFPAVVVAAILAIDSTMILTAVNFNPGAFVVVWFAALLLLMPVAGLGSLAGFLVLAVAAVLTHQLSVAVAILFVVAYAVAHAMVGRREAGANVALPLVLGVAFVLGFILVNFALARVVGVTFVQDVVSGLVANLSHAEVGTVDAIRAVSSSPWSNVLYKATLLVTSGLAIASASRLFLDRAAHAKAFGVAAVALLGLAFALPLFGIDLVTDRWLPVALVAGLGGLALLLQAWSTGPRVALLGLLIGMSFLGITQPSIAHDTSFYAQERNIQEQFNEPDLAVVSLATTSGDHALTDVGMTRLFRAYDALGYRLALSQVSGAARVPSPSELVVREALLAHNALHFAQSSGVGFARPAQAPVGFLGSLDTHQRVADEGPVVLYRF